MSIWMILATNPDLKVVREGMDVNDDLRNFAFWKFGKQFHKPSLTMVANTFWIIAFIVSLEHSIVLRKGHPSL